MIARKRMVAGFFLVWVPAAAQAGSPVGWGAFVDTYLSYETYSSPSRDRAFSTQAARQGEFNVNLAFLEAKLSEERVRGRMALQAGTSVQANYAGEPAIGAFSGPTLTRHIQEAYGGVRLAPDLWLDAGIFFSHIGLESWISSDNWTYTRSLVADYSPYYQAGVRAAWKLSDRWSVLLCAVNGWQIVSESNDAKSLGTQIAFAPNDTWSLTYSTLFGVEKEFRQFHDFVIKGMLSKTYQLAAQVDVGHEVATWSGFSLIQRFRLNDTLAATGRVERYWDPRGAIAVAADGTALQAWGGSLGLDYWIDPRALIRTEFRVLRNEDAVFPSRSGNLSINGTWTTNLTLRL